MFHGEVFYSETLQLCSSLRSDTMPRSAYRRGTRPRYPEDPVEVWEKFICRFSHPHVMSRLERLMGTNVVVLTDRKYMLELQRRIQEDHVNAIKERIKERERDELDREKNLILEGKVPLAEAPQELVDHPVFRITQMANDFIKELNEKSKAHAPKFSRPSNDETPCSVMVPHYQRPRQRAASVVPPQAEQSLRFSMDSTSTDSEKLETQEDEEESEEKKKKERRSEDSDIQNGYLFPQDQYDRLHYETDHVKAMWTLETVEDLYNMAEQVIKDVVAHRPQDGDSASSSRLQPSSSTKSAEDSNFDHIDTPLKTQSPPETPKTGMKLTKTKIKEEKNGKKQRFSWPKKK